MERLAVAVNHASWPVVIVGLFTVVAGLIGNLLLNPAYIRVFFLYFGASLPTVTVMLLRVEILKAGLAAIRGVFHTVRTVSEAANHRIVKWISVIHSRQVVYYALGDDRRF